MPVLSVYYDGGCPLCSREIAHYRRRDQDGRLRLIDIAAPAFDARIEGLDAAQVHRQLHVRLPDGGLVTGVHAFAAIWRALGWARLAALAESPPFLPLLSVGYAIFSRVRPYLPRRRDVACADGACARR